MFLFAMMRTAQTPRVLGLVAWGSCLITAAAVSGSYAGQANPLLSDVPSHIVSNGPTIKQDADLVLVNASVTDPTGRPVTDLNQNDFRVFEDNSEQEIIRFSSEDVPASIGIVLDTSGSMDDKFSASRLALTQFLQTANPQDEFFLTEFSDRARLDGQFTQDIGDIQNRLMFLSPRGRTALFDAIYLSLDEMKEAANKKRALLIISDGGDNHSKHGRRDVVRFLKEADVQIYAIGIYESGGFCPTPEECSGPSLLRELSKTSGGEAFRVSSIGDLSSIAAKLSSLLRSQYLLAYNPHKSSLDAKWHKIKVDLRPPKGSPPLTVHARAGYFGPATLN